MRVVDAVRRSMCIPIYFAAVRDKRKDVFIDGGVFDNYPIKLFDRVKYVNKKDKLSKRVREGEIGIKRYFKWYDEFNPEDPPKNHPDYVLE